MVGAGVATGSGAGVVSGRLGLAGGMADGEGGVGLPSTTEHSEGTADPKAAAIAKSTTVHAGKIVSRIFLADPLTTFFRASFLMPASTLHLEVPARVIFARHLTT